MKVNELIRLVERAGWVCIRQKDSHRTYIHPEKPEMLPFTIAAHGSKELKKGTEMSIRKAAGI
jgi:predicted RNA binding protein YcfA (HicA-like mRNA interferase family)